MNSISAKINVPSYQAMDNAKAAAPAPKQQETPQAASDSVSLGSAKDDAQVMSKKKWTILQYSVADNNLQNALVSDIAELESVGSSKDVNLVAQLDRGENPSYVSGGWGGCKRFYLTKDSDPRNINSKVLENMGQVNMSDPKVLADFIKWGMKEYPAEHFMLVVSDHGAGWMGAMEDESHNGWMTTPMIKDALQMAEAETGKKLDVLGFDACLMATGEVAHELKDTANFMVASQETEGGDGWPYKKIFGGIGSLTPQQLAEKVVTQSKTSSSIETLSAYDLSKAGAYTSATDDFAKQVMQSMKDNPGLKDEINKFIDNASGFAGGYSSYAGLKDQQTIAKHIMNSKYASKELKESAKSMIGAMNDMVIKEQHHGYHGEVHGVSAEMHTSHVGKNAYQELQFAKDTSWDEMVSSLQNRELTEKAEASNAAVVTSPGVAADGSEMAQLPENYYSFEPPTNA